MDIRLSRQVPTPNAQKKPLFHVAPALTPETNASILIEDLPLNILFETVVLTFFNV
jgi:hypothetical protein